MDLVTKGKQTIRIKDIAEKAGVSTGTVDRVLHGRGEVSEKTRQKVLNVIEQLGYKPNLLARSLASRKRTTLGVVIPRDPSGRGYWSQPLEGIKRALGELDSYGVEGQVFFFDWDAPSSFEKALEEVSQINPVGVLICPTFRKEVKGFLEKLTNEGIPFAFLDSDVPEAMGITFVGQDPQKSGQVAARLLDYSSAPGKDLLVLNVAGDAENYNCLLNREQGFRTFFSRRTDRQVLVAEIGQSHPDFDNRLKELINQFPNLGGIFVTNSRVWRVAQFLQAEKNEGLRLIGFDVIPENKQFLMEEVIDFLINQRPLEQGFQGIKALFRHLLAGEEIQPFIQMPVDIITPENVEYYC